MFFSIRTYNNYWLSIFSGRICNEQGEDIPPDTPPTPCPSDHRSDNWTPYHSWIEFKVANFLYHCNQISGGDINFILNLWAASLVVHDDTPPFADHNEMYDIIDSMPIGDVPWESFSLQYNGIQPEGQVPLWITAEYDVWFHDPQILAHNLISNPDFKNAFDYALMQEYSTDEVHWFQNFMSGGWAWKQAVSHVRTIHSCLILHS